MSDLPDLKTPETLQRVLASLSVAFARISALEAQLGIDPTKPKSPGPFTNTPATHAATEAAQAAARAAYEAKPDEKASAGNAMPQQEPESPDSPS